MLKVPTIVCFDVEDPLTLRSHRAAQWMCEALIDSGVVGTTFLVAEKVRAWERLGLRDVIEAVKPQDMGFHTTRHSFHPTISEISETLPARPGAEMLWGWERPGWEDAQRIMGRPINNWGLSGGSWSPALAVMLGQRGHALAYSPIRGDDPNRPVWFAGGLNFSDFLGGLDASYRASAEFETVFESVKLGVDERLAAGAPCLCLFGGHPTRVVHDSFWDLENFREGRISIPEEFRAPAAISAAEELVARQNFNRCLSWVKAEDRFELMGFSELVRRFSSQRAGCSRGELLQFAGRIADAGEVLYTEAFTAAEMLSLMVDWVRWPQAEMLYRRDLLGPQNMPADCSAGTVSADAVLAAAPVVAAQMTATRALPDTVDCGGYSLFVADYFVALARTIAGRKNGAGRQNGAGRKNGGDGILLREVGPYPAIGDELAEKVAGRIRDWIIHRPDLDLRWIMRDTRLLAWTFKPAWTREELARI